MFQFKKISLHLLNLGAPHVSQEGEESKIYWTIQTNPAYENCNWLASKTWSIQGYESFTLEKISLHLLNLGAPPVSQEGEERIIHWIIQTNTAYENCNRLASKTWRFNLRVFYLKKVSLHLLNLGAPPVSHEGEERKIYWIIQTNTASWWKPQLAS